MAPKNELRFS